MGSEHFFRFILVLGFIPFSSGLFEPAYLKVCGKEEKHVVESRDCSKGIWLRQSFEPGCICVRGVWALSNGFCDERAVIIVGDGHCFHIGFEIRSAKLIGDPHDPFRPKVYVAPTSLDAFYEVVEGKYTPDLQSDTTLIIGVNPRQVAQRKDFGVCLDLPTDEWDKPVHIYMNPRRSIKEWMLNAKEIFTCPVVSSYKHHVGFGDMFLKDRVEPRLLVERHCREDCPGEIVVNVTQGGQRPMGRTFDTTDTEYVHAPSSKYVTTSDVDNFPAGDRVSTFTKLYVHKRPAKTPEERELEKNEARAVAQEEESHFAKEANEQTLRMMHAHISPLLLNVSSPQVATPAYKYFQILRRVIEKACPQEYVPKLVVRGLMRMFRQLLWETQDTFTHADSGDDDTQERIVGVLNLCLNMTNEPSMLFSTLNESYTDDPHSHDSTLLIKNWPNASFLPPERCPNPMIFSINSTDYNRTHYDVDYNVFVRNISNLGVHMKFNSSEHDFVIETAWKIALTGIYKCSRYFNESSYTDYYTLFTQMQTFFNEKILKRWYYKPSIDATFHIVQMMFPAYNLKKFVFGIDTCLLGAHRFGAEDWASRIHSRPKIPGTPDDLTQDVKYFITRKDSETVQALRTHHISSFDYAPHPHFPDAMFPKPDDKYPTPAGRRKREANYSIGFDMWGNKARCIRTYMDPVTKEQAFEYHIPPGCVTPLGLRGF